jgi:hypothetical protein
MKPETILVPLFAQVLLTLVVWAWMIIARLSTILRSRINPQKLADEAFSQTLLKEVVNPSDNVENLFELPVLFYVAMIVLFITNGVNQGFYYEAWAFVFFRALHSWVHCTSNRILPRFSMYVFSSVALCSIWIQLGLKIIQ